MECLHGVGHGVALSSLADRELDLKGWTPCASFRFNFPGTTQVLSLSDATVRRMVRRCHAAPRPQLAFGAAVGMFHEVHRMVRAGPEPQQWHWPCGSVVANLAAACFVFGPPPLQFPAQMYAARPDVSSFASEAHVRAYIFGRGMWFGRDGLVTKERRTDARGWTSGTWRWAPRAMAMADSCSSLLIDGGLDASAPGAEARRNRWLACSEGVGFAFFYTLTFAFDLSAAEVAAGGCGSFAQMRIPVDLDPPSPPPLKQQQQQVGQDSGARGGSFESSSLRAAAAARCQRMGEYPHARDIGEAMATLPTWLGK